MDARGLRLGPRLDLRIIDMTNHLTEPSPGDPISATLMRELIRTVRASRIIGGRNVRCGYGPNGTVVNVDVPRSGKSAAAALLHPWKIYGGKRPESGSQPSKAQRVYVPAESLVIEGGAFPAMDIIGLTADADLDDFYALGCLDTLPSDTPSIVHLFVYREIDPESEGADPQTYAEVASSLDDSSTYDEDSHEILAAVPLFSITRSEDDNGRHVLTVNIQYQHSAIAIGGESSAPAPSKNDVGLFRLGKKKPEPGEEPSDNLWLFNTYLRLGSSWVRMNGNTEIDTGTTVESWANQFLFLWAYTSVGSYGPEFYVVMAPDFSVIERDSRDPTSIVIPLYHFDENGAVDIDFRIGAGTDAFDLSPIESVNDRYNQ